jgi:hypothetical protein
MGPSAGSASATKFLYLKMFGFSELAAMDEPSGKRVKRSADSNFEKLRVALLHESLEYASIYCVSVGVEDKIERLDSHFRVHVVNYSTFLDLVAEVVRTNSSIHSLSISGNHRGIDSHRIADKHIDSLCAAIKANTSIKFLELSDLEFTSNGYIYSALGHIKTYSITGCAIKYLSDFKSTA